MGLKGLNGFEMSVRLEGLNGSEGSEGFERSGWV